MVYHYGKRVKRPHRSLQLLLIGCAAGLLGMSSVAFATDPFSWLGRLKVHLISHTSMPIIPSKPPKTNSSSTSTGHTDTGCGIPAPPQSGLANSAQPELQKLAEYETVCKGALADRLMIFTGMPATSGETTSQGQEIAASLKELARFGVQPLVILEPTTSAGQLNFHDYRAGTYDSIMDSYFAAIKAAGITDQMMGLWVPFPEANTPAWNDSDPSDFAANVTKTVQFQKKYFPSSQAGVLLDSQTYANSKLSWDSGTYTSLLPYVTPIPKGLIDSFGLQGFPWTPAANDKSTTPSYDAGQFLNPQLAQEAATQLGIKNVWLNTGTFTRFYTNQPAQTVTLSVPQRQAILNSILAQAQKLQTGGFHVAINLFSEDKSGTDEAIDWSYWPAGGMSTSPYTGLFTNFVHDLKNQGTELWLYDSTAH